jgi:uncharacterized membrane protein
MTPPPNPPLEETPPKKTVFSYLRTYFFTGIVVAAPLLITLSVVQLIITSIDDVIRPFLPPSLANIAVPGFGLAIAVLGLTLLGAITANLVGRLVLDWADRMLFRIPLIKLIYKPVKQVFDRLMRPGAKTFRDVVLIEYPRPGAYALAFKTSPAPKAVNDALNGATDGLALECVFVPTSPNLYAGFLLMLPASALTPVAMSVEQAISTLVSAGIASNPQPERSKAAARSRSKT